MDIVLSKNGFTCAVFKISDVQWSLMTLYKKSSNYHSSFCENDFVELIHTAV